MDCAYIDNHGPPCQCETLAPDVIYGLKAAGWHLDEDSGLRQNPTFFREFGQHIICVTQTKGGWMHKWQRASGATYTESQRFGTLAACLEDLWLEAARMIEEGHRAQRKLFAIYNVVDESRSTD